MCDLIAPHDCENISSWKDHFLKMAEDICKDYNIPQNSLAIDIGSNVGYSTLLISQSENVNNIVVVEPNPLSLSIAAENLIF